MHQRGVKVLFEKQFSRINEITSIVGQILLIALTGTPTVTRLWRIFRVKNNIGCAGYFMLFRVVLSRLRFSIMECHYVISTLLNDFFWLGYYGIMLFETLHEQRIFAHQLTNTCTPKEHLHT